jgi:hypothetical protein
MLPSGKSFLAHRKIEQAMFPTTMPWPMTLASVNEAIRLEIIQKKLQGKNIVIIQEVM